MNHPPTKLTERGHVLDVYVPGNHLTPQSHVADLEEAEVASAFVAAIVDRWVDGDTVDLRIRLDFVGLDALATPRVRLYGVDTPERGQEGFLAAKERASELAPPGSIVTIRPLVLKEAGNLIAEVFFNGVNINQTLIDEGLGRAYSRRKREPWPPASSTHAEN